MRNDTVWQKDVAGGAYGYNDIPTISIYINRRQGVRFIVEKESQYVLEIHRVEDIGKVKKSMNPAVKATKGRR